MTDDADYSYFQMRKEGKTYISKVFTYDARNPEWVRNVRMVLEGNDELHLGEIGGALCLRLSGDKRKTQVTVLITQDDKHVKRITLQTFKSRLGGWINGVEKEAFTFRADEFDRLLKFLKQMDFIDLSNQDTFHIDDISTTDGHKTIIDSSDRGIVQRVKAMSDDQREGFLREMQGTLTQEEVNILLGRKQGLEEYERHLQLSDWAEAQWQDFFERQQWIFGYGLDYRVMRQFGREMTVGAGGTDNQNKPVIDFLMTFTDYTVLVEIKKPDTKLFRQRRGGRAGTWEFSPEFMGAVSQIIEQKAEWLAFSQSGPHYNKAGAEMLTARTRNAKSILVIGSAEEISGNSRDATIMRDTFELFRRECRSIDIVTYDELLDRARFITRSH